MNTLRSVIESVLGEPVKLRVTVTKAPFTIQLDVPKKSDKKRVARPVKAMQVISTPGGLMRCTVPDFEPAEYKGLKRNCGRVRADGKPLRKHTPSKQAQNPTNVGDPNKRK